jgi:hypothetical protein
MSRKEFEEVSLPEIGLVAATRVAIGIGVGFLLSNKLSTKQRKAIGIPLLAAGALSTIPIAMHLFNKEK